MSPSGEHPLSGALARAEVAGAGGAPRWLVACDTCGAGAWIGPRPPGAGEIHDAWCEGCQSRHALSDPRGALTACPRCGTPVTLGEPRFEELPGEAQQIVAVLAAWCGDPGPLAALLPDRPRLLTDDTPTPASPEDPPGVRAGLEALAQGHPARARDALAEATRAGAAPRLWRALGIAAERLGDLALAEQAFSAAIEADPHDGAARLARGALRARRRDFATARADFAAAGDRPEARWNRAALDVIEAVAGSHGLPDPGVLRRARAAAGEPSSYWSDPTVGRLLWTLLVERESAPGAGAPPDARMLEAAERELEFGTFWDRALVVHGYTVLGLRRPAGEAAAALAGERIDRLIAEPFARGPAGAWLATPLAAARTAVDEARPGDALAAIRSVAGRDDVQRYRVPCHACRRGSVGVEASEEAARSA
jgi:tetratricopeptide (TPR) repeat protein